jgi:hypothetical protein
VIDVVATQRVVMDLVLDDEVRQQWERDPTGFARSRLDPVEAAVIAGIDPVGMRAMARSNEAKKVRFDHLHAVHHAYEDAKLERLTGVPHDHGQPVVPGAHTHDHDHGHGSDGHTHDHDHDHDHGHASDGHTHDQDHDHDHDHASDGHTHHHDHDGVGT